MNINSAMNIFIAILFLGLIVFNIFRIILARRITKQQAEFETLAEQKMQMVYKDIQQRTKDLKESIDMINHEYSNVMKTMGKASKQEAKLLEKKLNDYKAKLAAELKRQGITPEKAMQRAKQARQQAATGQSNVRRQSPMQASKNRPVKSSVKQPMKSPKNAAQKVAKREAQKAVQQVVKNTSKNAAKLKASRPKPASIIKQSKLNQANQKKHNRSSKPNSTPSPPDSVDGS